ncbi:PP2C family protein-serine/threonine phosphatase [uncultured Jatrophihabitans sp.]|uniref:PP2C family protein-serine/threonine phosphatase n=1 Tax=uncultured Jatrophihabitans sp. TaxID=1610747 RepID=UPI0035C9BD85
MAATVILALTAVLAITVDLVDDANENRLLHLQTRQAGTLVQSNVENLATPLASAAQIAAGTGGDSLSFRRYVARFMARENRFESLTLWSVTSSDVRLVSTVGRPPELGRTGAKATTFVRWASTADTIAVNGLLTGTTTMFGYGYGSSPAATRYVVYIESPLRYRLRSTVSNSSPLYGLRFALYLGRTTDARHLLLTSGSTARLSGHTARTTVPFGTATLTLVTGAKGPLAGRAADRRWWVVLLLGTAVAVGAGLLTDRLVRRRRSAEALTAEIDGLLRDQRGIAESLQRALIPDGLPLVDGVQLAARYRPGVNGIEIGGDWYDVVPVDDTHVFFAVGDVSGRGLEAGSVMAALHFAIRAYAREGHSPATVLDLLGNLLTMRRDRHFATVVCCLLDVSTGSLTVASAGHLPMLLVHRDGSHFIDAPLGPPIGIRHTGPFRSVTVELPLGATLLAYTDGLVERRDETLDDGLARLRSVAARTGGTVEGMVSTLLAEMTPAGSDDDTAVLALRMEHRAAEVHA